MLHDPRHDKTPTLAGFALFLASKEPDARYEWIACKICAVGQYVASIGFTGRWEGEMAAANIIARGHGRHDWTFGQCADRVLAYQRGENKAEIDEVAYEVDPHTDFWRAENVYS